MFANRVLLLCVLLVITVFADVQLWQKSDGGDNNRDNAVRQSLILVNRSGGSIYLDETSIRYYFYDSLISVPDMHLQITSFSHGLPASVIGTLESLPFCERNGLKSDRAIVLKFPVSGVLKAGDTLWVSFNLTNTGSKILNESDDWSYRPAQVQTNFQGVSLFIGGGGEEINGSLEVFGEVISRGGGTFCDGAHLSKFHDRVSIYNSDTLRIRGGEFLGKTYVSGPVKIDSKSPVFKNSVGFNNSVTVAGTNDPIIQQGALFINGSYKTERTGFIGMNGNPLYGRSDLKHYAGTLEKTLTALSQNSGSSSRMYTGTMDFIPDSQGTTKSPRDLPVLNKARLDSFAIAAEYGWGKLFGSTGATSARINAVYDSISNNFPSKLIGGQGGFLVLRPKTEWAQSFSQDNGEVRGKIIWLFDSLDMKCSNGNMYKSAPNSISMIVLANGKKMDRFSGTGAFRGVVWSETGGDCIYTSATTIQGAVVQKSGKFRAESNGETPLLIKYDSLVVQALSEQGIFSEAPTLQYVSADRVEVLSGKTSVWGEAPPCTPKDTIAPVVEIVSPMNGDTLCDSTATISWLVDGVLQTAQITGKLVRGSNRIIRTAVDSAGNVGADTISVVWNRTISKVKIVSPTTGFLTNQKTISVQWSVDSFAQTTSLVDSLQEGTNSIVRAIQNRCGDWFSDTVQVNADFTAPVIRFLSHDEGDTLCDSVISLEWSMDSVKQALEEIRLTTGINRIVRTANDSAGNSSADTLNLYYFRPVHAVKILSPENGSLTNAKTATVKWSIDGVVDSAVQNLFEGSNNIVRSITNRCGDVFGDSISITADFTAPKVEIVSPVSGDTLCDSSVSVLWNIDGVSQATQTDVVLRTGANTIIRITTDSAGNVGSDTSTVYYFRSVHTVKILSPENGSLTNSKTAMIKWSTDGVVDSAVQTLAEGSNKIVRSFDNESLW